MGLCLALAPGAQAEKADRTKPLVVESDHGGSIDLKRRVVIYTGNVTITQGTMQLRADRIEMRQSADGFRTALAVGAGSSLASWRQKRDGLDETVEGFAERIEFDAKADTLRLLGKGSVRRLRGSTVADEITGANILWDNNAEVFKVEGGQASVSNPTGRVRAVLSPRAEEAADNNRAAPSPGSNPSLTPSRALGDRR